MDRVTKILAPIDFSSRSRAAVEFAAGLANRYGAELHLLHVFQPGAYGFTSGDSASERDRIELVMIGLEQQLARARTWARASTAIDLDTLLLQGSPADEIVRLSPYYGLVVLTTRCRTGLEAKLLNSVAMEVVRRSACPVVTVHPTA